MFPVHAPYYFFVLSSIASIEYTIYFITNALAACMLVLYADLGRRIAAITAPYWYQPVIDGYEEI